MRVLTPEPNAMQCLSLQLLAMLYVRETTSREDHPSCRGTERYAHFNTSVLYSSAAAGMSTQTHQPLYRGRLIRPADSDLGEAAPSVIMYSNIHSKVVHYFEVVAFGAASEQRAERRL